MRNSDEGAPSQKRWIAASAAAVIGTTIAIDFLSPLGVAAGVLYSGSILLVSQLHRKKSIWSLSISCSLLILLGAGFSSTSVSPIWVVVFNRLLSLVVVWISASVLLHRETLRAREENARMRIRVLEGLLPICMSCKKIRDENNQWHQLEGYITNHSEALFSHVYCSECADRAKRELMKEAHEIGV